MCVSSNMADTNTQISVLMRQAKTELNKNNTIKPVLSTPTISTNASETNAVSRQIIINFDEMVYDAIFQKFKT